MIKNNIILTVLILLICNKAKAQDSLSLANVVDTLFCKYIGLNHNIKKEIYFVNKHDSILAYNAKNKVGDVCFSLDECKSDKQIRNKLYFKKKGYVLLYNQNLNIKYQSNDTVTYEITILEITRKSWGGRKYKRNHVGVSIISADITLIRGILKLWEIENIKYKE